MLAMADVRVKRGSTWIKVAGFLARVFACSTQRKATGWHSAMLEPMIRMVSEFRKSLAKVVAPPRPNDVPRPGTVELCHIRAWFSRYTTPRPRISLHCR